MVSRRIISSILLLVILTINFGQDHALHCYQCESDDEKSECWNPTKNSTFLTLCGAEPTIPPPSTTLAPPTAAPITAAPITAAPTTAAPTTAAPTTAAPTTAAPTTAAATTVASTTAASTTVASTTAASTTISTTTVAGQSSNSSQQGSPAQEIKKTQQVAAAEENKGTQANSRRRRAAQSEWQCAKIVTTKDGKNHVDRKCVKTSDNVCGDKKNKKSCDVCDENGCNSASSLDMKLMLSLLPVFTVLFVSSR